MPIQRAAVKAGNRAEQRQRSSLTSGLAEPRKTGGRQGRRSPLQDDGVFALAAKIRVVPRKYVFRPCVGMRTIFLQKKQHSSLRKSREEPNVNNGTAKPEKNDRTGGKEHVDQDRSSESTAQRAA